MTLMSLRPACPISRRLTPSSRSITLQVPTSKSVTTSSQTGPSPNTRPFLDTSVTGSLPRLTLSWTLLATRPPSIGSLLVPSLLSRIRVSVAHAGLSRPRALSKVPTTSPQVSSYPSQSSSLSTAMASSGATSDVVAETRSMSMTIG